MKPTAIRPGDICRLTDQPNALDQYGLVRYAGEKVVVYTFPYHADNYSQQIVLAWPVRNTMMQRIYVKCCHLVPLDPDEEYRRDPFDQFDPDPTRELQVPEGYGSGKDRGTLYYERCECGCGLVTFRLTKEEPHIWIAP